MTKTLTPVPNKKHILSSSPAFTLHNTTHEDTDYGRESEIRFKGKQSGGEQSTLAILQAAHDGIGDDQKGIVTLKVNDGNDNDTPSDVITVDSLKRVGIRTATPRTTLSVIGSGGDPSSLGIFQVGTGTIDFRIGSNNAGEYGYLEAVRTGVDNNAALILNGGGGNVGVRTVSPGGLLDVAPGTTGGLYIDGVEATVNITAAHTCTIQVNAPSGAKILGCQLRVDTALAAGETWNAQYVTGATQAICTARAVGINTKVNKFFDENVATAIASAETDITIQRSSNPGVDVFTAQGTIRAIVYYQGFTTMANA